jgi:hypothetical protein
MPSFAAMLGISGGHMSRSQTIMFLVAIAAVWICAIISFFTKK